MRNEYNYPHYGQDRSVDDKAAQRRGDAWRPGDAERRRAGRDEPWLDGGDEGPPFPRREGYSGGHRGVPEGGHSHARHDQEGGDYGRFAPDGERLRPGRFSHAQAYGEPGDYSGGMDWSRSGSLRQDYGDYGHAMDDRRRAQEQMRLRNPGNEPKPYRGHHGGARNLRPPKGYTRSDERIREDVCEQLMADHYIDAGEVSVEVKDGVVTLTGSVSERNMRYALESVAASCLGVKDVENHVKVESADGERSPGAASQAARAYSMAQRYARDSGKAAGRPPSAPGLADSSVSDTTGLGGDQSRFIRPNTD